MRRADFAAAETVQLYSRSFTLEESFRDQKELRCGLDLHPMKLAQKNEGMGQVFDRFTAGGSTSHTTTIWTGEAGILFVLAKVLFATALMDRPWEARRSPTEEPMATFSVLKAIGIFKL